MKHWKKILKLAVLTACLGMLGGCGEKQETAVTPTPTEVVTAAPTATSTPVPTATSTPAPTATSTPVPTATSTPVPTATSTPVPTATSTPVPTATSTPAPTATGTPVPTAAPAKTPEMAKDDTLTGLSAFEITSQMMVGWNLGNTLDCEGSGISFDSAPSKSVTAWGNIEPTQELFEAVKDGGFNTVRIPTTWYQHTKYDDSKNMYIINEDWMDYVKQTVDYAYDLDMFVILNVHHENWANPAEFTDSAYQKASKMLTDIWTQVADTFAEYDQHLIFECMNEPRQTGLGGSVEWGGGDAASWRYIDNLNELFVNTIRSQGSAENAERLLMLPGYGASSNIATVKAIDVPENSGNVALSVHAYFPYFFAMATDNYANHSFPGKSGYGEDYETSIINLFKELAAVSKSKNVPIIIGECGASDFNNNEDRARWATCFLTNAKKAGIPCVFWDNGAAYNGTGEAYGLIYRKTCTWYGNAVPMLNAMMAVYNQESSLPGFKEYVKPSFDWGSVPVADDWVKIFRSDAGQKIDEWGNIWLDNWKPYLNENYDILVVFSSDKEPYMVLQGGWYKVYSGKGAESEYIIRFSYEDVQETMRAENVKLEDMYNFFVSASGRPMTVYGVYAVPVK